MNILVNGVSTEVETPHLDQLLIALGYADSVVATAVNSDFVPVSLRSNTLLNEGDQLEIISPIQGG
ncbi:sulfur carrier protein ThiS [Marinomonas algarum]|uniref:Sulfur carrier protein ThiS n=1 Tax=Marinomonas algarum TaxID=2883105 RepID=A0A9X1IKD2_9GAMM|nr:sulfur carrier protein ThiS [Marinomonas algarum]MCB5160875.1 sulfur carrier protein ThiS [Marinomonas algarum]